MLQAINFSNAWLYNLAVIVKALNECDLYSISIMSDTCRGSLKDFEILSRLGEGAFA